GARSIRQYWLRHDLLEAAAFGFEFIVNARRVDPTGLSDYDFHAGEGQRDRKSIPALESEVARIFDVERNDRSTGSLGKIERSRLQMIARAARTVRCDDDVVSFRNAPRHFAQGDRGAP